MCVFLSGCILILRDFLCWCVRACFKCVFLSLYTFTCVWLFVCLFVWVCVCASSCARSYLYVCFMCVCCSLVDSDVAVQADSDVAVQADSDVAVQVEDAHSCVSVLMCERECVVAVVVVVVAAAVVVVVVAVVVAVVVFVVVCCVSKYMYTHAKIHTHVHTYPLQVLLASLIGSFLCR